MYIIKHHREHTGANMGRGMQHYYITPFTLKTLN